MSWDAKKYTRTLEYYNELTSEQQSEFLEEVFGIKKTEKEKLKEITNLEMLGDYVEDARKDIETLANNNVIGYSTGYKSLDRLTRGLVPGELILAIARTSVGKSMFALNIAVNLALKQTPTLFVTLEMGKREIVARLEGISGDKLDEVLLFIPVQEQFSLPWQAIDGLVARFIDEFEEGLVVIDHLHYFSRSTANQAEELGIITKEFKRVALTYKVPLLLISHVRKSYETSISLDDVRGSSLPAQDCDIGLVLERDGSNPDQLDVRIEKNRNRGFDFNNDTATLIIRGTRLEERMI